MQSVVLGGQAPRGLLHGTPLQQSEACMHCWPTRPHTVPLLLLALVEVDVLLEVLVLVELLVVELLLEASGPPSGGGMQGPQVPMALPTGTTQVSPTQQSALTVHAPQVGTHEPPW